MNSASTESEIESNIYFRSDREERWNFATHLLGFVLAIVGVALLVGPLSGKSWLVQLATCIYAVSMLALYASSALSHFYHRTRLRSIFRKLDQAWIFVFIIAGYTPYCAVYLQEIWAWIGVGILWLLALWGFFSKLVFAHRIEGISMWTYLVLGWLPALGMPFTYSMPVAAMGFIAGGGACYLTGVGFLMMDQRVWYFHPIWHLLVIAGSTVHYLGIQSCLTSV